MAKRVNYRDRVEDGELDLSMSDLQEVPVRDIVSPQIVYSEHQLAYSVHILFVAWLFSDK